MSIVTGNNIEASDFISSSAGATDTGKAVKTDAEGDIASSFLSKASAFGDGSDGSHTVSGTETLTRDMYYTDLTVPAGQVLITAGYRIFCSGTLSGAGTIRNNGNAGTAASGATHGNGGTATAGYFTNAAGGNGGDGNSGNATGGNGSAPPAVANALVATASQAAGRGGSTSPASGTVSQTTPTATILRPGVFKFLTLMGLDMLANATFTKYNSSVGGGGGSGSGDDGTGTSGGGGGGGASGGIVFICARIFAGTLTLEGKGGDGGAGGDGSNNDSGGGGGAGGNGGYVLVIYGRKSWTGSYVVTGGVGGAGGAHGGGGGNNGNSGSNGAVGATNEINVCALT